MIKLEVKRHFLGDTTLENLKKIEVWGSFYGSKRVIHFYSNFLDLDLDIHSVGVFHVYPILRYKGIKGENMIRKITRKNGVLVYKDSLKPLSKNHLKIIGV